MQDASPSLRQRFSLLRDHHSSNSASMSHRQVYKLNIPDQYSSAEDFSLTSKTASTSTASTSSSSLSSMTSSLSLSFRSLRMPLRRHKSQKRCSIGTTGTSVVTICNEEEDDDEELRLHYHHGNADDDEDDIVILQPEEDEPSSPEKRTRRWRKSFSSMRMAISRSSSFISTSTSSKKQATTMYSISFYPWKRDPRAYYSHPEAAAEWVPDTASKRCQICLAPFNLTRRRHHCRLCGLLACNDCSLQRTYFPFSLECRSHHHLVKDGAPQRTCNACAGTLKNMAAQNDPRVKKFTVHPPVPDPFGMRDDGDDDQDNDRYFDARRSSQWRVSIGDEDIYVIESRKGSRRHLALASCGASQAQANELDEVLQARALSRRNPKPKYYVVSTEWLEMWLQYVHVDGPPTSHSKRRDATRTTSSRAHSKRPGPISNYSLLNFVSGKLLPKDNLERSRGNDSGGDYRIVSEEVWAVFLRLYGGGPCIQLLLEDEHHQSLDKTRTQQLLVRKNSALNDGSCTGFTDPSRWKIIEIDDTIAPLISKEPVDLLKGNKKMRRVASTSHTDFSSSMNNSSSRSTKQRSSVYPIRETAPCIMSDVERSGGRQQPYYPRDSIVNCITSPLYSITDKSKKTNARRHQKHQQSRSRKQLRGDFISSCNGSFLSSSGSNNIGAKVSVGTVLCDPVDEVASQKRKAHVRHHARDVGHLHHSNSVGGESPQGSAVAAVSAFALAASEARKKSAVSLSRHSSVLSSSMVKSQPRVSATSAPVPASA